jgi:hypothetical protein
MNDPKLAHHSSAARTDRLLLVLTALSVSGLAIVAGAISFAHMRELAAHHDQVGWKAYAFPISVDGLEIVASLYLVAQRRAGRPIGWIPWFALIVGTAGSLAANVAVGGADPIGKALAGWPAISMLVSIKLLFSMIDHTSVVQQPDVRDDMAPSGTISMPSADVADLLPAARTARATLLAEGRTLSRDNLADAMRVDGHGVSNERVSHLLKILKASD